VMALRHRGALARAALALATILMLVDFAPVGLARTQATCPRPLSDIAKDRGDFGVLDLPRGYGEGNAAMMLSACHGKPIVQGETSRRMGVTLADRLQTRDLAGQKRQLTAAHVKYIVLHNQQGSLFAWTAADGNREDYDRAYTVLHKDGDLTLLQVY
jgi:hypothetical protein